MKELLLGYTVETTSVQEFADQLFCEIFSAAIGGNPHPKWLACLNPHSYAVAKQDNCFAQALREADWLVADGAGIVLASKLLGGSIRERVTGSDVFRDLHARMNTAGGMSVFFLGATPDTLDLICRKMANEHPNIRVAGTYSPPFKPGYSAQELDEMISAVNAAAPDVLWVGMTAPKQEKWIHQNRHRLNVRFAGAVGAVFDFYVGKVKRSHPIFQRLGLEWLPRLIQQPRRLWRRMFVSAPVFLWDVMKEKMRCLR